MICAVSFYKTDAQEIKWLSFEEAISLNKENPKKILIDIYTDWCGFCKKMDRNTYTNKVIISQINANYYPVKLNAEQRETIVYKDTEFKFIPQGKKGYHQLAAAILQGKMSYPSTVILDKDEQPIQKIPGYLEPNFLEPILAYFSHDNFTELDWKDFQKDFVSKL